MYKNILQSIDNVAIWPMISFSIFFIFFLVLLWYVFTVDKNFIRKMENMPLDKADNTTDSSTTSTQNL
jgi:cytochrome c oxidase cbb3-type subunit IV